MWDVEKLIYGNENIFNLSKESVWATSFVWEDNLRKRLNDFGNTFRTVVNVVKQPVQQLFLKTCLLYLMEIWMQLRARLTSRHCMCLCVCMRAYIPISVFVWKGERLSGCMCYFCWASHIERTNNLFQLRQAAAPVTAEGAVLHRITSSFEKPQDWLIVNQGPSGTTSVRQQGERWGWQADSNSKKYHWKQLRWKERSGESPGGGWLRLCMHVGRGGKLIMWLRLIRWC